MPALHGNLSTSVTAMEAAGAFSKLSANIWACRVVQRNICSQPVKPGDEEGGQASPPEKQRPHPYRQEEERNRAHDAIIVAIGIVAVLIANVACVGYLSTPGGPNPWWADCDYPLFTAFMISNGFSLVFSVAAIVAVLVGPYILIMQQQLHWRQPVVNLGLCHLLCSLASLLAAFALAGFITASVGAPPLSCAKITCDRGGVPCSTYTPQASLTGAYDLGLDPVVAQLNNKTLSGSAQSYSADSQVVCHDYNYIACSPNVTMEFGQQFASNVPLLDTFGHDYGTSCYYLFTTVRFPGSYGSTTSVLSAQSSWRTLFTPNPLTMWCSADKAAVGPGFIPLNTETAYRLLDLPSGGTYYDQSILFSFDALSRRQTDENPHNFSSALLDPVAATTNCKWGAIPWGYVTFKPNVTKDVVACIYRADLGAESQRNSKSKVSNNTVCDFKGRASAPRIPWLIPSFTSLHEGLT